MFYSPHAVTSCGAREDRAHGPNPAGFRDCVVKPWAHKATLSTSACQRHVRSAGGYALATCCVSALSVTFLVLHPGASPL